MTGNAQRPPRYDFHAHTFLTDGNTSATDMWNEADVLGHRLLAITDHVGLEDPTPLLRRLHEEARTFEEGPMVTLVGVEITKAPVRRIADVARAARKAGAEIVIVHGETTNEHVPAGTNHAAISSGLVDILAHPGLLAPEDAQLARDNGTILEVSARRGHCLTNGHVVRLALEVGADLVVDSDAHSPSDLLPFEVAERVARGAGLNGARVMHTLEETPKRLLAKTGKR